MPLVLYLRMSILEKKTQNDKKSNFLFLFILFTNEERKIAMPSCFLPIREDYHEVRMVSP